MKFCPTNSNGFLQYHCALIEQEGRTKLNLVSQEHSRPASPNLTVYRCANIELAGN